MPLATVYRDTHGMPHIVSAGETQAWYALGYEQARDGLLWIQYACKAAKGELTWVRGSGGLTNDFAVKVFDSHGRIARMSVAHRRALLAPTTPGITGNFYDNCVAYAAGADAYRQLIANAPASPVTPESTLKAWLSANRLPPDEVFGGQANLAWVWQHPIEAVDIAAMGGWTAAVWSFRWPPALVNAAGASYGFQAPTGPDEIVVDPLDPLSPGSLQSSLQDLRQHAAGVFGAAAGFSGSNTFAWSGAHCRDAAPGTASFPGLVGDPHQGIPSWAPNFAFGFKTVPNHLWYAHIKVHPPGAAQPTLDVLGHVPHGSAAFFTAHNRNIAMGGTLGGPNHWDYFLLRLQEGVGGTPATPRAFYSYYHDSTTSPSNATFVGVVNDVAPIKRWDGSVVSVPYWRAESFGAILPTAFDVLVCVASNGAAQPPMPIVHGERVLQNQPAPRWRVSVPPSPEPMRFWRTAQTDGQGQPTTSPMVVALRAPIDAAVAGDDRHWQMLRDFWEIGYADDVDDVRPKTNSGAYSANVCFVDRAGRTFTTQLSAIPERGLSNAAFGAANYHTLDKWAIYAKGLPVPARHSDDRLFDWQFGGYSNPARPAPLRYLEYPTTSPPGVGPWKPMSYHDPSPGATFQFPPPRHQVSPFQIESGTFASACNDLIWGYSRKRDLPFFVDQTFANVRVIGQPEHQNNPRAFGNLLFQWALDAGVVYQTGPLGFEGPDRQQFVLERFRRQSERMIVGGSAGLPPLTPAQMREFAVSPELYHEPAYLAPAGVVTNASLPIPIRQLHEVVATTGHGESPLAAAQRELDFFTDLWTALFTNGLSHQIGTSPPLLLRDVWVRGDAPGHSHQIFWYPDPTAANPTPIWIDLPDAFPLIDFYWEETELGRNVLAGDVASTSGLLPGELATLGSLVNELIVWDPAGAHYRTVPTSKGACLLEMMRKGYGGRTEPGVGDFGRHWVRLRKGHVEYSGTGWQPLTDAGKLPSASPLVRQHKPWDSLADLAFPGDSFASLFRNAAPDSMQVPLAALYVNPVSRTLKTALSPADTNALVRFFLALAGCYIDPQQNGGNPSRKLARYQVAGGEAGFVDALPARYPLTDGLQRLTVLRALLDTRAFLLGIHPSGVPPLSFCFRSRAYDRTGQVWPALPAGDVDCVGGGLRSVVWWEDGSQGSGRVPHRGYQQKFLGIGGSIATLLAMFPSDRSGVDSHFWCTPGIEVMSSTPGRFAAHMNAFATNSLLPTYYDSFLNHVAWSVSHAY